MGKKRQSSTGDRTPSLRVRLQVGAGVIGPGKIELLRRLESEGTISAAARAMGLSYRRAWYLIDTMNAALGRPVTETQVGGEGGGGASLTPFGRELVRRYGETLDTLDDAAAPLLTWLAQATEDGAADS